jgi:membrane protease YdiL (CAAX protease family)
MKNESNKRYIALFLIFSFGITLIYVFLIKSFSVFQSGTLNFILFGIAATAPTISALMVTSMLGGGKGLKAFLKKCYVENMKSSYIILALLLPSIVLIFTKLTSLLFIDVTPFISGLSPKKLVIIFWALIAEELGWRGFLQEKFEKRFGYMATPLVLGCIWALWHSYSFFVGTHSAPIILFVLGCIAESYSCYWITKKSKGNCIPASIWHFTGNLWSNLLLINPEHNQGSMAPYLLYTIYAIIMAGGITIWGIRSSKKEGTKLTITEGKISF